MNCPPEIAEIVLAMLEMGLIRIRALSWSGQSDLCATETDHLHNLPRLVADYTPEKLRHYWEAERPSYAKRTSEDQRAPWEPHWDALRPHAEHLREPISTG